MSSSTIDNVEMYVYLVNVSYCHCLMCPVKIHTKSCPLNWWGSGCRLGTGSRTGSRSGRAAHATHERYLRESSNYKQNRIPIKEKSNENIQDNICHIINHLVSCGVPAYKNSTKQVPLKLFSRIGITPILIGGQIIYKPK